MRITQSLLGNADKCLLSLQYGLDKPEWFKRIAGSERLVGTGFHAGLELLYLARLEENFDPTVDQMIAAAVQAFDEGTRIDAYDNAPVDEVNWSERVPDYETAHHNMSAMLTEYVEGGHAWPIDWTVIGVEVSETVTIGEHSFKLGADLALRDPNGWIVLVDHKTANKAWDQGKHKPRKNNQGSLYTELAKYVWPDEPGYRFVFDIMQPPNASGICKFDRRICDPAPEHGQAILKKATDLAFLYDTVHVKAGMDLPANPASTLCNPKWCDYFAGCPHGAALDN
jgi:hypothetical protein